MYARADALLNSGNFTEAAKKFEDLDRDHPYAAEARRAIVMAAYAYYKAGKYPEAIASARRYTTLHPGTKDAALAHHIIASANFDDIRDPGRDQTATRKALAELKTLVQRYPDSPYTKQAGNRIRIAEDTLAGAEMHIGRYYQKRNNHVAAINRYKVVVSEYQTTAHVEEALYRLVETNMSLGIVPEAQTAAAVLGHNYPNSQWYTNAHALLKSGGVSPQINQGTWVSNTLEGAHPGRIAAEAAAGADAGRHAPAGTAVARGHALAARALRRAGVQHAGQAADGACAKQRLAAGSAPIGFGFARRVWISRPRRGSLARMKAAIASNKRGRQADRGGGEGRARAARARDRAPRRALLRAGRSRDLATPTTMPCASAMRPSRRVSRASFAPTVRPRASAPRRSRLSARCAMPCRCSRSAMPSRKRTWSTSSPACAASWGWRPTLPSS